MRYRKTYSKMISSITMGEVTQFINDNYLELISVASTSNGFIIYYRDIELDYNELYAYYMKYINPCFFEHKSSYTNNIYFKKILTIDEFKLNMGIFSPPVIVGSKNWETKLDSNEIDKSNTANLRTKILKSYLKE